MDIPLTILAASYQTDQGDTLIVHRPFVNLGFRNRAGRVITLRAVLDTGAPVSVVPY